MRGGFRPNSGRKKGSIPWNIGIPMSIVSKRKLSLSKKGISAWNKGIPMKEEVKRKLSISLTGLKRWPNGRKFSRKTREKMRLAKIGKPSGRKGTKLSKKWIANISEARRKYLLKSNPNYDYRLDTRTKDGNKRIRR